MSMNRGIKRKGKAMLLATLAAVTLLAGCSSGAGKNGADASAAEGASGGGSGSPTEISFYFSGSQNVQELWEHLKDMYEQKQDKVKVKLVYIPSGQGEQATMNRIVAAKRAGKDSVDVDLYEANGGSDMAADKKDGVFESLSEQQIPNLGLMNPANMKDLNYKAVPYRSSSVLLAYNSEKVPSPPKTLDDLYAWIHEHPGRFAYNDPATGGSGESFVLTTLYKSLPEDAIHNQDPNIMKEWDKGFEQLKALGKDMYQKGVYPKKNQGTLDLLANGEVDMIPAWSDMALEQINKKLLPETTKLAQIEPAFTGGPGLLTVPSMSKHKEAAYDFIDFVLSPEAQAEVVNEIYGFPGIEWSHMPSELQEKFKGVSVSYRSFNLGELESEAMKRWQREVAGQ
ncbi:MULTISPECIES: extracellular solute-binding protein [Paenibacillus]|uniref:ABC transporter substrate-binding protein n=1 Tax=Paenibacillus albilobatus TaxID=2716884 RepID=A0A919XGH8_9BACL|nr:MULTISPECIES: extracellular solute-binding protein [Paenibacillus]GIO30367.1 ABC transporter substrate-binding protein [Paenibacillus albilobatus]